MYETLIGLGCPSRDPSVSVHEMGLVKTEVKRTTHTNLTDDVVYVSMETGPARRPQATWLLVMPTRAIRCTERPFTLVFRCERLYHVALDSHQMEIADS